MFQSIDIYRHFSHLLSLLCGLLLGYFYSRFRTVLLGLRLKSRGSNIYPSRPEKSPNHIAVIMDGNRRYGRLHYNDPLKGHWDGGKVLLDFCQWCIDDGVKILTVYAFSSENWNREVHEVNALMTVFSKYAESLKVEAVVRKIRVKFLSTDLDRLPINVICSMRELELATQHCSGFQLNVCLSYGGRAEIVGACRRLLQKVASSESVGAVADYLSEALFSDYLVTKGIPDPEVLIRTSNEYRLSNFLLWQVAYSEMFFLEKNWPELSRDDLREVIADYNDRKRRFGK